MAVQSLDKGKVEGSSPSLTTSFQLRGRLVAEVAGLINPNPKGTHGFESHLRYQFLARETPVVRKSHGGPRRKKYRPNFR